MNQNLIHIPVINKGFSDLNPVVAGYEKCESCYSFGPYIREYFLIHYVVSGCGRLKKNDKTYDIHSGSAFLIRPNEVCLYTADEKNPWEYIWIGFTGSLAEDFYKTTDIFNADEKIFKNIIKASDFTSCRTEYLTGKLYELYCSVFSEKKERTDYVRQASDYIDINYDRNITITSIADIIGIERTYLAKLFKKKKGISMQEYLVNTRLRHAYSLLKNGYSVSEAATMSGYSDVFNFSKMFKNKIGKNPSQIKKSND